MNATDRELLKEVKEFRRTCKMCAFFTEIAVNEFSTVLNVKQRDMREPIYTLLLDKAVKWTGTPPNDADMALLEAQVPESKRGL